MRTAVSWVLFTVAGGAFLGGLVTAAGSLGIVLGIGSYNTAPGDIPPAYAEFSWALGAMVFGIWLEWIRRALRMEL